MRDRNSDGRPQQARPRDELGRPLPYGSAGIEPEPEVVLPPVEALARAWELLDAGRPFAAHEVLELRWKAAPDDEGDLWQGLAQLCVAITHAARGNATGAHRLLDRGQRRVAAYADRPDGDDYGADLGRWVGRAQAEVVASLGEDDRGTTTSPSRE